MQYTKPANTMDFGDIQLYGSDHCGYSAVVRLLTHLVPFPTRRGVISTVPAVSQGLLFCPRSHDREGEDYRVNRGQLGLLAVRCDDYSARADLHEIIIVMGFPISVREALFAGSVSEDG